MKISTILSVAVATISLSLTAGVRHASSQTELNKIIKDNAHVIVDIYASWCPPCQQLAPVLEQLARLFPDLVIVKIDGDQHKFVLAQYGVRSFPTLIFFKNGSQVHRGGSGNLMSLKNLVTSKFGITTKKK